MTLWHFNIDDFPDGQIQQVMLGLPNAVSSEITRYRSTNDKKSRLIARILVQKYVSNMIFNWDWHSWKKGKYKKPYIEKGPHFNISHSGKMVVVCFSKDAEVGVDIEQIKEIDTKSMSSNFHKDEITWLENNSFQLDQFYTVWTRKEAFLKAKGQGLMEGMDQLSILNDQVMDETEWHLREIDVFSGYKCCLCSSRESSEVTITQIDYNTLNKFIDEKILL